jgi:hypothetical protein
MALTFTAGTVTTTASEADIFTPITVAGWYGLHIFTHNMTATETFVIRVYLWDSNATAAYRLFDTITLTGDQTNDAAFVPVIPTQQYKVTVQRTAGTDRVLNYVVITQT